MLASIQRQTLNIADNVATIVVQAKFAQTGRVACLVVVRRQNVEESV